MVQDMPWPETVTIQFELVNKLTTNETEFNGPFNTLLHNLFPPPEHYQVSPFKWIAGATDFTVFYISTWPKVPVMLLQPNTYTTYDSDYARKVADNQMRERFLKYTGGNIPIPKLYGICTLGTRICVYEYTVASRSLTPLRIAPPNIQLVADVAPKERWSLDIMEPQGEARLREIVRDIKAMVADLK